MKPAAHFPYYPQTIARGKVDGELVDENGFYLTRPETFDEIVRRYNLHAELLDLIRRGCEKLKDASSVIGFRYSVIDEMEAAIARAEAGERTNH